MPAAIYVRISQDREGGGLGVARQEEDCRALAAAQGYDVAEVYCDNDVSAYSGRPRPEYERMLSDIAAGRLTAVICWHTDRLHRSTRELETYIDVAGELPTHTVRAGVLDLSTASGRMVARITGAVARHESEHKSERQRRKADELARRGLPLGGGRPFGYEADGLTIRESEAAELRGMVGRVLAGDSLASILRDLNARGVLTTRGKQWGYTSLRSLLMRERNAGRMVHRGHVVGAAAWPPIIDETEHDAVSALLADPSRRTSPGPARRHLLSGLAKCACGAGMKPGWVKSRSGKKHWIYTCPQRRAGHAHRSMERVDAYVTARVLDVLSVILVPSETDRTPLEAERAEIDTRREQAALLFAAGEITASQLAAATAHLNARSREVLQQLGASARAATVDRAVGISEEEWAALTLDRKRQIIDAIMTISVVPLRGSRGLGVTVKLRTDPTERGDHRRFSFTVSDEMRREVVRAVT